MIGGVLAILLVLAAGAFAQEAPDTRNGLIAQMVTSGFNEFGDTRHTVEVHDCVFAVHEWMLGADGEWRTQRSLEWPMQLVGIDQDSPIEGQFFVHRANDDSALNTVIISFRTVDGGVIAVTRHLNKLWADLGDGPALVTPGIASYQTTGLIIHKGPDVEVNAKEFTESYLRYRHAFCE